jgi:hypothetical protein
MNYFELPRRRAPEALHIKFKNNSKEATTQRPNHKTTFLPMALLSSLVLQTTP